VCRLAYCTLPLTYINPATTSTAPQTPVAPRVHFGLHTSSGAAPTGSQAPRLQQDVGIDDPFVVPGSSNQVSMF
jgi:hypothetical protein